MKTRCKVLIAAGIFLALMSASLLLSSHYQPSNEVVAYKKFLRDRGEKLELSEVLPPPVPAESNSVAAVEDAFHMFVPGNTKIPNAMKLVVPGKALIGWQQPEVRGSDFTNSWEEFSAYVEANRPASELLHQVLERPQLDFNLDYKKGAELLLPHLAPLKRSTITLAAAVASDLHNGDASAATTNLLTMLALVQKNSSEGLLISHLVRIAMTAIAVAPTWEFLQTTNVTDAQLAAVQSGWQQIDCIGDATNAFTVERAWMVDEIQKLRVMSHEDLEKSAGLFTLPGGSSGSSIGGWDWEVATEKPRIAIGEFMWRSSWSYSDEMRTLKGETIILDGLRQMQTNQIQNYKAELDAMTSRMAALGITNAGAAFFRALKISSLTDVLGSWDMSSAVKKSIRMEAVRRVVVTAIALKRFELKHGHLPKTLGELASEFSPAVPLDPYDGKPLRYRANGDGTFLLYSIGDDGVDNGGDPTVFGANLNWQNARDWVWPQPASALEIQTDYEDEAKKAK